MRESQNPQNPQKPLKSLKLALRVSLVLAVLIVALAICCLLKPKPLQGDLSNAKTITIPLGGNQFIDIQIPGDAVLIHTDYDDIWEFNKLTISKTASKPFRADLSMQLSNCWLAADSKEKWLIPTKASFEAAKPYTSLTNWNVKKYLKEPLPVLPTPEGETRITKNGTVIPASAEEVFEDDRSALWYTPDGGVLKSALVYSSFPDAYDDTASRMSNVLRQDWKSYYHDEDNFMLIVSGDFLVAVRRVNLNTHLTLVCKGDSAKQYALLTLRQ